MKNLDGRTKSMQFKELDERGGKRPAGSLSYQKEIGGYLPKLGELSKQNNNFAQQLNMKMGPQSCIFISYTSRSVTKSSHLFLPSKWNPLDGRGYPSLATVWRAQTPRFLHVDPSFSPSGSPLGHQHSQPIPSRILRRPVVTPLRIEEPSNHYPGLVPGIFTARSHPRW